MNDFKNKVKTALSSPPDLIIRDIVPDKCCIFFIKNMTDRRYITDSIIFPLMNYTEIDGFKGEFDSIVGCVAVIPECDFKKLMLYLLGGGVIIAIKSDKLYTAFCPTDSHVGRGVEEPASDVTVRGPKAGFTENGEKSISQLRKIIRTENFKVETFYLGKTTKTPVSICFVEGRADDNILQNVRNKIKNFSGEYIIDSSNLEMLLCDGKSDFFPTMGSSEKVDKVASKILAGRIGIICDGSPYVLTAPYYFIEGFQSAEDYLKNPWYASFLRFIRFFAFAINLYLPSIFIAMIYHHSSTLPQKLLDFIHSLEENSAISMFWEMLLMLILFELIREVGVRMPRTVGDAAGLVGSLILGDAAVEAGISSITIIVIVAVSAASAYITPAFASSGVILRFAFLFGAYFSGLYGILALSLVWVVWLFKRKSFGVGYMYPIYPFNLKGLQDYLVVMPQKVFGRNENKISK